MAKKSWDYIVVGHNLTATLLATELSELSDSVLWVQTRKSLGERSPDAERSLEYLPAQCKEPISWLNDQFLLGIDAHEETLPAITFEEGQFKDFVGFGERDIKADAPLRFYVPAEQMKLNVSTAQIRSDLRAKFKGEVLENAEVTEIQCEDSRIQSVVINGGQSLQAEETIFAHSPDQLIELIPSISPKWRTKISKAPCFHKVTLSFEHSENISESLALNFLMPNQNQPAKNKKKAQKPEKQDVCIGRFFNIEGTEKQCSTWVGYIDRIEAEDPEAIGALIRFMKKQIKRAYPEALETVVSENIVVTHEAEGHIDLDLGENARPEEAKNLIFASPRTTERYDWVAEVIAAQNVRDQIARL